MKIFPGRGGAKTCAETIGVSPQQWSPWETGKRTPNADRLQMIADLFDVTVEYLCTEHIPVPDAPPETGNDSRYDFSSGDSAIPPRLPPFVGGNADSSAQGGVHFPHCRQPVPGQPSGSPPWGRGQITECLLDEGGVTVTFQIKIPLALIRS